MLAKQFWDHFWMLTLSRGVNVLSEERGFSLREKEHTGDRQERLRGSVGIQGFDLGSVSEVHADAFSCNVCVCTCESICMCIFLSTKGPGSRDTPVAVNTSSAQSLVSNVLPPLKEQVAAGQVQRAWNVLLLLQSMETLQKWWGPCTGYMCQFEGTPGGHTLGNLNTDCGQ